jgi:hypothetical protein
MIKIEMPIKIPRPSSFRAGEVSRFTARAAIGRHVFDG